MTFFTGTNAACYQLEPICNQTCLEIAAYCNSVSHAMETGFLPVEIGLYIVGGVLLLKGTTEIIPVIQHLAKKNLSSTNDWRLLYGPESDPAEFLNNANNATTDKTTSVWKSAFNTGMYYTFGSLPMVSGAFLHKIPSLFQSQVCDSMLNYCPDFGPHCVEVCNGANVFIIDFVMEILHQYS